MKIEDETRAHRFVLLDDDDDNEEVGEMTYVPRDGYFIINHTFVEPAYGGHGYAGQLVAAGVEKARATNEKIVPLCPFANAEFNKKSDYADVWLKKD